MDWGIVDERAARNAVARALELGITLFDTADVYGLGRSEERLGVALGSAAKDAVIATKFGINWRVEEAGRAKTFRDASPRRVQEALEGSLRRLGIDCIPLYFVHWPDPATPIQETMETLLRCRAAGKVRYVGLSNFSAAQIRAANAVMPIAALQVEYNLITRSPESELIPQALALSTAVFAYGPLAQGLLTAKFDAGVQFANNDRRHRLPHFQKPALHDNLRLAQGARAIGEERGMSTAQVAIRWILQQPGISVAIAGAKSASQVDDNVGAAGWTLSDEEMARLHDLSNWNVGRAEKTV
jgi:aryl-alcohol dehydrogenase-like predicted oxidoreductase